MWPGRQCITSTLASRWQGSDLPDSPTLRPPCVCPIHLLPSFSLSMSRDSLSTSPFGPPVIITRHHHRISITVGWNPFDLSLQFLLPSIRNHHIVEAPLLCSVCEPGFSKLSILSQSSLVNPGPRQRAAIRHKKRFRAAGVNQKYRFDIWSSFRQKRAFLMRVKRRAVHLGGALE